MTAAEYNQLLLNFDPKDEDQRKAFEKITYRYPYFQSAYAHYLKALKEQEQYNFELILRKTSILSPSRVILHDWIEKENSLTKKVEAKASEKNLPPTPQKSNERDSTTTTLATSPKNQSEDRFEDTPKLIEKTVKEPSVIERVQNVQEELKKEIEFPKKDDPTPVVMTYMDWIKYSEKGKITKEETKPSLKEKLKLIDAFIENNPKIPPVKQDQPKVNIAKNQDFNKEELMTETLAKVYLQQKKFKKALLSYKILSLKYPEKNSFFADQIKYIKQLQQNK